MVYILSNNKYMNTKITILAFETTCDDTAISIVEYNNDNFGIISNLISSQIKDHNPFGGVVPELASRIHIKNIIPVLDKNIDDLKKYYKSDENIFELLKKHIDYIAITNKGGGLIGSQVVGVETAKTLSFLLDKPIISVNHIRAHILASFFNFYDNKSSGIVENLSFPIVALTISGGHTQLILIKDFLNWEAIGKTTDDAAGECFDKIAKLLNLGYPGGPIVSKMAEKGDPEYIKFPRPIINTKDLNFSFSGLKTAVLYYFNDLNELEKKDEQTISNICASSQQAIIDVLVKKSLKAIENYNPKLFILAGGVAANKKLRETLKEKVKECSIEFLMPEIPLCMDNALMVNIAAYFNILNNTDIFSYKDIKSNINRTI